LLEQVQGPADKMASIAVRDLHMSVDWSTERTEFTPCIASSSNLWARGPRDPQRHGPDRLVIERFLSGSELLMLQGLYYSRQKFRSDRKLKETFKNSMLVDLAGNAFNAAVLYPLMTAVVLCAPLAESIRLCTSARLVDVDGDLATKAENQMEAAMKQAMTMAPMAAPLDLSDDGEQDADHDVVPVAGDEGPEEEWEEEEATEDDVEVDADAGA